MTLLLDKTLQHLRALVAFDTRNPPRVIGTDGVFDYLRTQLPGFDVCVTDHGAGAVSLFAVRGAPKLLFNVHLDTVPDSPHWTANPFALRVTDERAIGLGACDIKGAAAALLAVANASDGGMALLFTTDEEGADPRCIRAFLHEHFLPLRAGVRDGAFELPGAVRAGSNARDRMSRAGLRDERTTREPDNGAEGGRGQFAAVIVAEPTRCEAVLAHRGIQSVRLRFEGRAGHASGEQTPADSALHQAVRWSAAALDYAQARADECFDDMHGMRFNLGRIEGGIKSNVIAPEAEVRFGMRPLPSADMDQLLERMRTLVEPAPVEVEETFRGAALPAASGDVQARLADAHSLARQLGIPVGAAVDFWTEAALFSQAGCVAIVFGPGAIAQAHSADEWVALAQLRTYAEAVLRIVGGVA